MTEIKNLIDISKLGKIGKIEAGSYTRIYIKNPYPILVFLKDLKEMKKRFGIKLTERYSEPKEALKYWGEKINSAGRPYLPAYRIKLYRRHLVFSGEHLNNLMNSYPQIAERYLNERFGKEGAGWVRQDIGYAKGSPRVLLIRNILKKNLSSFSRGDNHWLTYATTWDKEICLQHTTPPLMSVSKEARKNYEFTLKKIEVKTPSAI